MDMIALLLLRNIPVARKKRSESRVRDAWRASLALQLFLAKNRNHPVISS